MGQKTNPKGLRLGIVKEWDCSWYAEGNYADFVIKDFEIRKFIHQELERAGVASIIINRKSDYTEVIVYVARPGMIFGKSNIDITIIKKELKKLVEKKVNINIIEEKVPDLNSRLLGVWIAGQLERRVPFRRAMKMAVQRAMKSGAEGIKVNCAGRLGGVEIARTEWYKEGKVPLHTLRADIDYTFTEAMTTYGKIGIKVWIYKGEILKKKNLIQQVTQKEKQTNLVAEKV